MWGSILGAGIGAIGNLAGGMISSAGAADRNAQSIGMAREQMAFSAQQAQNQMDFQERMSNTAYQRAMGDMRSAGLNPILAYSRGGASSPGGAMGSSAGANFENAMEGLGQGVSSASRLARNVADLELVKQQANSTATTASLNKANENLSVVNAQKAAQETATSAAQMRKADADTALTTASIENPAVQRALMRGQETSAYASAGLMNEQREQLKQYGPHWVGQAMGSAERVFNRVRSGLDASRNPGTGIAVPQWLSSDNPYVQQRIHNRRGVTVHADNPGLNIDIRR